jgi:hypothetical protein
MFDRIKYALQQFWNRRISGERDNDRADGGPGSHFSKTEAKFISVEMARSQHDLTDTEAAELLQRRLDDLEVHNDK